MAACYRRTVLRPSDSLLYSSRSARRAHVRAERQRAVAGWARGLIGVVRELIGIAWDLALLVGLPVLYLAGAYFVLDVPARWLFGGAPLTLAGVAQLLAGILVSLIAIARMLQQAPPIQPVTPQFARRALVVGWIAALLMTIGDLAA
jgi:hypothetical protein